MKKCNLLSAALIIFSNINIIINCKSLGIGYELNIVLFLSYVISIGQGTTFMITNKTRKKIFSWKLGNLYADF